MAAQVMFHNVDRSDALVRFIDEKSRELKKLLWKDEDFHWVIEHDAKDLSSQLHLKLVNKNISVSAKARNAFSAAQNAFNKAKRLVVDDHKRLKRKPL